MKKYKLLSVLAVLAVLVSLCGCAETVKDKALDFLGMKSEQRTNGTYVFTKDVFPKIGTAVWNEDLGRTFASAVLDIETDEAAELTAVFDSDDKAYEALCDGRADIIFAFSPTEKAKKYAQRKGVELEMSEEARDGLVFVCSADNTVSSLTAGEIKRIYMGEITSWKAFSGDDTKIYPFMRREGSVSRLLFEKYIVEADKVKAAKDYIFDLDAGLLETEADYSAQEGSIGYTLFSYISGRGKDKFRGSIILRVNATEPTLQTVGNGTYFMSESLYAVIRKDAKEDSPERILYNYILSGQGKEIAVGCGYSTAEKTAETSM